MGGCDRASCVRDGAEGASLHMELKFLYTHGNGHDCGSIARMPTAVGACATFTLGADALW